MERGSISYCTAGECGEVLYVRVKVGRTNAPHTAASVRYLKLNPSVSRQSYKNKQTVTHRAEITESCISVKIITT